MKYGSFLSHKKVLFLLIMLVSNIQPQENSSKKSPENTAQAVSLQKLNNVIKNLQKKYVRESSGTRKGKNFTEQDFDQFMQTKKMDEVIVQLNNDNNFKAMARTIRMMEPAQRMKLLSNARKTYRKTWKDLDFDPSNAPSDSLRKGQSDVVLVQTIKL